MAWTVWGDLFDSGELANTTMYTTIKMNKNIILTGLRTWIIIYNDPTFTNLRCNIYSDNSGPVKLLYTSTNYFNLTDLFTSASNSYAVKEIYFNFNSVPINGEDNYNIVLSADSYTPTSSSYLAWMKAWPDPVYSGGFTVSIERMLYAPYQLYVIGGEY